MKAKDIMTRTVVSIDQDATVLQAARLMLQHHIAGCRWSTKTAPGSACCRKATSCAASETHTERRRSRWLEFSWVRARLAGDYVHSPRQ